MNKGGRGSTISQRRGRGMELITARSPWGISMPDYMNKNWVTIISWGPQRLANTSGPTQWRIAARILPGI
eukprot:8383785-Pyramimonas_sp.AAC.1